MTLGTTKVEIDVELLVEGAAQVGDQGTSLIRKLLSHQAKESDPASEDGLETLVWSLAREFFDDGPSEANINQKLVDLVENEEEVCLDTIVEMRRNLRLVLRSWHRPCPCRAFQTRSCHRFDGVTSTKGALPSCRNLKRAKTCNEDQSNVSTSLSRMSCRR